MAPGPSGRNVAGCPDTAGIRAPRRANDKGGSRCAIRPTCQIPRLGPRSPPRYRAPVNNRGGASSSGRLACRIARVTRGLLLRQQLGFQRGLFFGLASRSLGGFAFGLRLELGLAGGLSRKLGLARLSRGLALGGAGFTGGGYGGAGRFPLGDGGVVGRCRLVLFQHRFPGRGRGLLTVLKLRIFEAHSVPR